MRCPDDYGLAGKGSCSADYANVATNKALEFYVAKLFHMSNRNDSAPPYFVRRNDEF